ncbi:hypothetical protein BA062_22605 [Prauserella flavalba]|uniref:Transposase for insertion sequence element IS21-like C-terminal domain-containing protein n=1 Tax=Prauserella flavalba TaxID=1477506 RepID=A0A318LH83_9PSEU|nr:hypothetical protein BA062_22605 [Prauserella flavalba]
MIICRPADPESKGLIERAPDYLERSFLPGRDFGSPAEFNGQMAEWLAVVNARPRRVLGLRTDRADHRGQAGDADVAAGRPATAWRCSTRLPRDHYIRLGSNDYSVHPTVIGRRVEIIADLARVRVVCDGKTVADHERAWAWHQTISDREQVAAAKVLRRKRIGVVRPAPEPDVEQRCLPDYDTALGLNGDRADGGWPDARHPRHPNKPAAARDLAAEIVFLTRALKAPTLRESVARLAERARAKSWSHEEFLVACLHREVSARESHGGEGRIRAAGSTPK